MGKQRTANNRRDRAARNAIGRTRAAAAAMAAGGPAAPAADAVPKITAS